ncbi:MULTISPECIES: histidine phosphatase family protein [unclassified Granulicatella]|uniref:histidine phosphatase family protein n=1 Tax=unclassified Granulicatella TaxID=2630493 RepID=UPI00107431F9|nr:MULTISPECIES: histidine phosphatase family protein [unclassified Granulicatella]MBF0780036.1 histidine phosphatase family protein [Granulicatella sp. 19428wC4_WM01]TFU95885.1 histidine phosphatase family protein [Granulicatella sp. WM01]
MTVTFYFVRHGETYLNRYERMQGWSNAPLTKEGQQGCVASGRGLSHIHFDAVYTSDLKRTRDTAELMLSQNSSHQKPTIIEKEEFREIFFGSFEGLEVEKVWPKILKQANATLVDSKRILNTLHDMDEHHDAENYMMFWSRVEKGMLDLLKTHKNTNQHVLVVSHGMTIRMMLEAIIPNFMFDGHLLNASVSKVRYENGQFYLDYINRTDHFVWE